MADFSGKVIKGYEIETELGAGGFGAVYKAYQTLLKREVAVKVILPKHANQPEFVRRFETEAQLVARLDHLHIVPIYDYWRDPSGAYIVMRFLRGGNLQASLSKHGPWSLDDTARMLEQIGAALVVAHRNNVIHRDLKPANIMLDEEGNAYLADFGVAKDIGTSQKDAEAGMVIGSPAYMSPEQIRSQPVTPQTDIYSLGIVLYETITGRQPFTEGDSSQIIISQLQRNLPSLREIADDLPDELDVVIQTATAKNPTERYPDALELAKAFRKAVGKVKDTGERRYVGDEPAEDGSDTLLIMRTGTGIKLQISDELLSMDFPEPTNPYKGLRAFQESDSDDFFGRETLTQELLDTLRADHKYKRFLAVVGPSGSGKSSVVKAGVMPAIRKGALPNSDRWFLLEMVPGVDPMAELETKLFSICTIQFDDLPQALRADNRGLLNVTQRILTDPQAELLLVVDQFEECFTQGREGVRAQFLENLLHAVTDPQSRVRVIVTLRADFYDQPLLYPDFGELLRSRTAVVLPLNEQELENTITRPSQRVGITVQPDLIERLVGDVKHEPGALPLLQYVLTELFERREGFLLTLDAYLASGGVLGALARRADELYVQMTDGQKAAVRQLFLRLVTLGEGQEDTRRRIRWSEILSIIDADMDYVLTTFTKYRLLTTDNDPQTREPTVEVAHEALIRRWELLREWLAESRDDLRLQRRLTESTEEWLNHRREASFLASGLRLQQLEILVEKGSLSLSDNELAYINASVAQREAEAEAERIRQAREAELERRSRQRLRMIAIISSTAAVVTLFLAVLAFISFRDAQEQRDIAQDQRDIAQEQRGIAEAQRGIAEVNAAEAIRQAEIANSLALSTSAQLELNNDDTELAIYLAQESIGIADPPTQSRQILLDAAFSPGVRRVFNGHQADIFRIAVSPDSTTALSTSFDNTVRYWDLSTGQERDQFSYTLESEGQTYPIEVWDVAYLTNDTALISIRDFEASILLVNLQTGEEIRRLVGGHADVARAIALSPDHTKLVSGSEDTNIVLWNIETGEILQRFTGELETTTNAETGEETTSKLSGHTDVILDVALSPDGRYVASAGRDGQVLLWDVETAQIIRAFEGHTNVVRGLIFTPDGGLLLTASLDNTIRAWDVESGIEVRRFVGHGAGIKAIDLSPNGIYLVSASDDNTVRIWDLLTTTEIQRFTGHGAYVETAVFMSNGDQILSGSGDLTLRLWDVLNGGEVYRRSGHSAKVNDLQLAPDGQTVVSVADDSTAVLRDVTTGEILQTFAGMDGLTFDIAFLPDGNRFFAASFPFSLSPTTDLTVLWDIPSADIAYRLDGYLVEVDEAGETAVTAHIDTDGLPLLIQYRLNSDSAEEILRVPLPTVEGIAINYAVALAYSPNAQTILYATVASPEIIIWDMATQTEVGRLFGHTGQITGLQLIPNTNWALSVSNDATFILWDLTTQQIIHQFEGHIGDVLDVAYNPNGTFASVSTDGTIRFWSVESGTELYRLSSGIPSNAILYLPSGDQVMTGGADTTVRLWNATPLSLDELRQWIMQNRYVPDYGCSIRERYRLPCDEESTQ